MPSHQTAHDASTLKRLLRKAHAAHVNGALAQAEKSYKAALDHDPDNFEVLHRLGVLSHQRGRLSQALRFLAAAVKRNAGSAEVLSNHGLVLHALGRTDEAIASYEAALEKEPDNIDVLNKIGIALLDAGRPQEALTAFDRTLARAPRHVDALGNRGNAFLKLNRPEQAISCYDTLRWIEGDTARLLTNRAHALRRLDRPEEALADLHKAVALDPNYAEAQFELGIVQLTLGDFDRGWAAYERRWATAVFASHRRDFKSPLWTGEQSLNGRTILLHGEQGLGDTIQFARYAAPVARLGATVILEVEPELAALMAGVEGPTRVIARGDKLAPFDLHCPLMSLPRACKTSATNIPMDVPYIKIPEVKLASSTKRLPARRPLVGVCWAGRRSHHNDANRSIALARFAPLFETEDVEFISLQRDVGAGDRALLRNRGNVLDIGDELRDFADTAALISQLNLVVAVDTAVAHLAGALAKPLALLLPFAADFRWLRVRADSPWYPSATLFRQPRFDDWESVIERVSLHMSNL
ncbi:MAG TPA: tetratricopeptide repeat protein [Steroidobacteraceae bacterium]|jgi:tetratricopeptide (TPR) repeat protein